MSLCSGCLKKKKREMVMVVVGRKKEEEERKVGRSGKVGGTLSRFARTSLFTWAETNFLLQVDKKGRNEGSLNMARVSLRSHSGRPDGHTMAR